MKTNKIQESPKSVSMDAETYNKVHGKIPSDTSVTITGDKPLSTSGSVMEDEENIIEPKDNATIKYLSNVKDINTGEISKPFTIADKNYQIVRGITPSREIVLGVFCHDELNYSGE